MKYKRYCKKNKLDEMNCKLEKFWNKEYFLYNKKGGQMNCKLEKFWNIKGDVIVWI